MPCHIFHEKILAKVPALETENALSLWGSENKWQPQHHDLLLTFIFPRQPIAPCLHVRCCTARQDIGQPNLCSYKTKTAGAIWVIPGRYAYSRDTDN